MRIRIRFRTQLITLMRIWMRIQVTKMMGRLIRTLNTDRRCLYFGWKRIFNTPRETENFPVLRVRDVYPGSDFFRPGSGIHIKEFKYFNPKNWFSALGNMIWVVHPESGSRIRIFYSSRIPDSKDTGSRIRIRNTAIFHKNSVIFTHHCQQQNIVFTVLAQIR
jgi:hypothetical protein